MKKLIIVLGLMLTAANVFAQQPVAVTATVTGANGAVYSNGTYQIQLVDATGAPVQSFGVSGGTQTQTQFSGALSSAGSLAVSLYANTVIGPPTGPQWSFHICSAKPTLNLPLVVTAQVCFVQPLTITAAGDVSARLSASAPALYTLDPGIGVSSFPSSGIPTGSGFALPAFPSASGGLTPSNLTTDATGNNLNVPGNVAAATAVLGPSALNMGGIVARGDSFTAGGEGNTDAGSYSNVFRLISTPGIVNAGIGGTTSTQVCVLMGACSTQVTSVTGGAIPACTSLPCAGTVGTFTTGSQPLISSPFVGSGASSVSGIIQSTPPIPVMVTVSQPSGNVYTFTPTATTAGATIGSPVNFMVTNPYPTYGNIIWAGRNNIYTTGEAQILSDTAAMVAAIPAGQSYLVVGMAKYSTVCQFSAGSGCTGTTTGAEWSGTANATLINSTNAALQAAYPNNYVDANAVLMAAYNPSLPTDVSDIANGIPPTSLRAIDGQGTLTSDITAGTTGAVTTCNITVTLSVLALPVGDVATIDDRTVNAENVMIITAQNTTPPYEILTCVRGYGGVNGSHATGAAVTITENSHLRAEGYTVIANQFASKLASLTSLAVAQSSLGPALSAAFQGAGFYSFGSLNTAAGAGALSSNTTGSRNTAVGTGTLTANTTAVGNTGVGTGVLGATTTGGLNTGVGTYALKNNVSGIQNTAMGYFSLYSMTGNGATAVGYQAGEFSTLSNDFFGSGAGAGTSGMTATSNAGFAANTLAGLTSGTNNVAMGTNALKADTSGSQNTCIGFLACQGLTTTSGTTAVGFDAFFAATYTGTQNTGIGFQAGSADTSGSYNTFTGYVAGGANTSGSSNTVVGRSAFGNNTTGSYNTAIGATAGNGANQVTSTYMTYLGDGASASADALTDSTAVGALAQVTASHQIVLGASTVTDVYAGSATGAAALHGSKLILTSARKGTFVCTVGGTITVSNTNEIVTSDVIISLNTAGGTITTPPAMTTVTAATGFTVLCGATDTSTYNYLIVD